MHIIRHLGPGGPAYAARQADGTAREIAGDIFGEFRVTDRAVKPGKLLAPVAPSNLLAIGLNYRSHAEESGMTVPEIPATFTKFPASLAGPFDDVELPGDTVDWEVELVAVIGRRADRVPAADGWAHIAGLAVGQDISERTVQFAAGSQFSLGKSFRGFGPVGPWLVTPDELDDPDDLGLGCAIDGVTVQDARTSDLIFDIPTLIETCSRGITLLPGDVIATGTAAGVGMGMKPPRWLQHGDVVRIEIDGLGTLQNRFVLEGS